MTTHPFTGTPSQYEVMCATGQTELWVNEELVWIHGDEDGLFLDFETLRYFNIEDQNARWLSDFQDWYVDELCTHMWGCDPCDEEPDFEPNHEPDAYLPQGPLLTALAYLNGEWSPFGDRT